VEFILIANMEESTGEGTFDRMHYLSCMFSWLPFFFLKKKKAAGRE